MGGKGLNSSKLGKKCHILQEKPFIGIHKIVRHVSDLVWIQLSSYMCHLRGPQGAVGGGAAASLG